MKKLLFILVSLSIGTLLMNAEVSLVAILSHGDEITTFQSTNAYAQAVDKAVDGDVITLSSGNFTATDITKNITVRGAGMMPGENPTVLNGKFTINIDPTQGGSLTIEGIYSSDEIRLERANEITLLKSWLHCIAGNQNDNIVSSIRFIHCFIPGYCNFANKQVTSAQFINSYVESFRRAAFGCTISVSNCIMPADSYGYYNNSIVLGGSGAHSTFSNCVSNKYDFNGQPITAGNKYMPEVTDFFKEGSDRYELKDEYAAQLLGSDGTQVGIHGGSMPFDPTTTSLKISKFNVGARTTADGKLPVEIEVNAN